MKMQSDMKNSFTPKLLPIKDLKWESFIYLLGKANTEMARFDGLLQTIPNPAVLLSPFITNEAVLSSRIEGTQATFREVLEYGADPRPDAKRYDDIKEIINYRNSLQTAVTEMEQYSLTSRVIKKAHKLLLEDVRGKSSDLGNFRRQQVFIGRQGDTIENAVYIPPSPEKVADLMSNLEKYIHSGERDPLVQLAIIHAQFEMIHPFLDGNGRVGRMLMPLFLYLKKSISYPSFYLSGYLESHRSDYYKALLDISENENWEGWILFFLNAVIEQSKENTTKTKEIITLYTQLTKNLSAVTKSQFISIILDTLFEMPVFKSQDFMRLSKIPKASAFRFISLLEKHGIIASNKKQKNKMYFFTKLLDVIK